MEENEQASQEEKEVREEDKDQRVVLSTNGLSTDNNKRWYWGKRKTDESKTKWRNKREKSTNRIMANHLRDKKSSPEITDAVSAMKRTVEINLEIKRPVRKEKKTKENSRVKKMKKQIKELRQLVARTERERAMKK